MNTISALNPRKRIGDILEETLKIHGMDDAAKRREQVIATLGRVGLSEEHYFRCPHELSGGQVQLLGIAGVLIIGPKLIICDEPVSALTGEQPVRTEDFAGCAFCSRCPYVMERCRTEAPKLKEIQKGHKAACHKIS